jgi:methanogenic corrinoid protein MtbC1
MVADAFQLGGWEVQYLGANVPTAAVIQHVGHYACDLLGLSVSFAQELHVVREIIAGLALAQGDARPPVIVGGLAINQFGRLAGELGADGWSRDASSAVVSASKYAQQPAGG